jgi:hypothetical protein
VSCAAGNCDTNSCRRMGQSYCTSDGTSSGTCTSSPAGCTTC